jgi:shikimate dehydrogenase
MRAQESAGPDRNADRSAVVGNPIAHSKSPEIHAAFAAQTGHRLSYERLLASLDAFVETVEAFRAAGGIGLNVTVPFKVEAFRLARQHSERARLAEAVNTLAWRGDHWYGDNTDGAGIVADLMGRMAVDPHRGRVLILGAGGAVRGVLKALLDRGPERVVLCNRTMSTAEELAHRFAEHGSVVARPAIEVEGRPFDLVINATSVSLASGATPPWPAGVFASGSIAYDLVYGEAAQPFLDWASENGAARVSDGLGMLVEQAAESFWVWRGVRPDTAPVLAALRGQAAR